MHEDLIKACTNAAGLDTAKLERWRALLSHNDIYTVEDWLTAKTSTSFKSQTYGDALVGYLDKLAGVRSPGTRTIRAWRFFLALL